MVPLAVRAVMLEQGYVAARFRKNILLTALQFLSRSNFWTTQILKNEEVRFSEMFVTI